MTAVSARHPGSRFERSGKQAIRDPFRDIAGHGMDPGSRLTPFGRAAAAGMTEK